MRVLVTGASGRIGRHLLPALHAAGHQPVALSRRPAGASPVVARQLVETLSPASDFAALLAGIDAVVHLADGFNAYEKLPVGASLAAADERLDTLRALTAAVTRRQLPLVYLSTVKAQCGSHAGEVLTEAGIARPASLYGRLKRAAETSIIEQASAAGSPAVILRFPIVFGAGIGGNMQRLLQLAATPWPLPFAGLAARRSLISVETLIAAVVVVLERPRSGAHLYLLHDGAIGLDGLMRTLRRALDRNERLFALPPAYWRGLEALPNIGETARRFTRSLELDDRSFRSQHGWPAAAQLEERLARFAACPIGA